MLATARKTMPSRMKLMSGPASLRIRLIFTWSAIPRVVSWHHREQHRQPTADQGPQPARTHAAAHLFLRHRPIRSVRVLPPAGPLSAGHKPGLQAAASSAAHMKPGLSGGGD